MMKRKCLVAMALASTMVMGTAAYAAEDVTIVLYNYMSETPKQIGLENVEKAFAETQPDYNITWDNKGYNQSDYFTQLQTAFASGDTVDLMMGNPSLYPDLIDQGFVEDLTGNEFVESLNLSETDLGDASYNGTLYAVPIDFKSWGVYYNTKIFEENGLEVPKTLDEMIHVCDVLKENGIEPYVFAYADAVELDCEVKNAVLQAALKNGDNDIFEKLCNGEMKIQDYPYYKEILEAFAKNTLNYITEDALSTNQQGALEKFVAGKGAMVVLGTWMTADLEAMIEGTDFSYDIFAKPFDNDGEEPMLTSMVDQCFMINSMSKHKDLVEAFLKFWATEGAEAWSATAGAPLLSATTTEGLMGAVKTLAELKAEGKTIPMGAFTTSWTSQFTTIYRKHLVAYADSYAKGEPITADQCLENMQAEFDQVLAENK